MAQATLHILRVILFVRPCICVFSFFFFHFSLHSLIFILFTIWSTKERKKWLKFRSELSFMDKSSLLKFVFVCKISVKLWLCLSNLMQLKQLHWIKAAYIIYIYMYICHGALDTIFIKMLLYSIIPNIIFRMSVWTLHVGINLVF